MCEEAGPSSCSSHCATGTHSDAEHHDDVRDSQRSIGLGPFPTAVKLRQLEHLYERNEGRAPTESELAQLASLSRGEVRRLKNILGLPKEYLRLIENEQVASADQTRQWITSWK